MAGVGQFDDGTDLLCRFGKDDGFRNVVISRIGNLVKGVRLQGIGVGDDVLRADDGL